MSASIESLDFACRLCGREFIDNSVRTLLSRGHGDVQCAACETLNVLPEVHVEPPLRDWMVKAAIERIRGLFRTEDGRTDWMRTGGSFLRWAKRAAFFPDPPPGWRPTRDLVVRVIDDKRLFENKAMRQRVIEQLYPAG